MPSLRTRTVSTKVTEDDYALFAQLAGDLSVGEWVREVLLKAVLAERTAEAHRTILGELLARRKILLNLQFNLLGMNRYVANATSIGIVTLWNFWLNTRLSWRVTDAKK